MRGTPKLDNAGLAGDASVIDDVKAFNQGKGRLLAAMIALGLSAVGGLGFYLVQDQPNPYSELGKQVNGLRLMGFDQFWTCALPNTHAADLTNNSEVLEELHRRGAAGARYAAHLQNKCAPPLRELGVRLRALAAPPDAAPLLEPMAAAITKMDVGVRAYAGYLQTLEGPYARDAAEPELESLVRGWYEFRKAHVDLNQLVKGKLGR